MKAPFVDYVSARDTNKAIRVGKSHAEKVKPNTRQERIKEVEISKVKPNTRQERIYEVEISKGNRTYLTDTHSGAPGTSTLPKRRVIQQRSHSTPGTFL